MKRLAPQKKNKRNIQQQHHHDQWIYEETAEMSDLLVINTPQIKIVGVDLDAGEEIGEYDEYSGRHSKDLVYKAEHKIIIRPTRSPWRALSINSTRFTIALELLHLEYPRLRHGVEFDNLTKVLVEKWKENKENTLTWSAPSNSNFLNCYTCDIILG